MFGHIKIWQARRLPERHLIYWWFKYFNKKLLARKRMC